jgi:hypothetical protein
MFSIPLNLVKDALHNCALQIEYKMPIRCSALSGSDKIGFYMLSDGYRNRKKRKS